MIDIDISSGISVYLYLTNIYPEVFLFSMVFHTFFKMGEEVYTSSYRFEL